MATQNLRGREEVADDLAGVRAYLAERGVFADRDGTFSKRHIPAIEEAIREREWLPTLKRAGDEWVVILRHMHNPSNEYEEFSIDADPVSALLHTLDEVRKWMTQAESAAYFDREARRMTGLSGEEFVRRWDAGELDYGDPHVIDVGMLLPRGR
jgi:hypothetical protein